MARVSDKVLAMTNIMFALTEDEETEKESEVKKIILDLKDARSVLHDLLVRLEAANNGPDVPIRLEFGQSHIKDIQDVLG